MIGETQILRHHILFLETLILKQKTNREGVLVVVM